jgi:hypothetical protein
MRLARVALLAALAAGFAPRAAAQERATFGDVLRLVQERGWRSDFHGLCHQLDLPELADRCVFRQLSIQDDRERGYPRGFNVSEATAGGALVFLFHLTRCWASSTSSRPTARCCVPIRARTAAAMSAFRMKR